MKIIKITLFVFVLSIFISKPASAGFESCLYAFFGGESETILLAFQTRSFLEENIELQKGIIVPLSVAVKNSFVRRKFVEVEIETINNHDFFTAPTVYIIEILVNRDKEIAVFLKKNGKVKSKVVFKEISDFKSLADDIINRLLDNSKEF